MQDLSLRLLACYQIALARLEQAAARARSEEGQTMVEYGLLLALLAIASINILFSVGTKLKTTFSSASSAL